MKSYEVRLSRFVTQKIHTTVSVAAETDDEAIVKAKEFAVGDKAVWGVSLVGDPEKLGEIKVESVEAIVDLDEDSI